MTNDSNFMHGLLGLSWVALFRGNFQAARVHIVEAQNASLMAGTDSISITSIDPLARFNRGWMELAAGDAARASETLAVVVAVGRSSPFPRFTSVPLVVLAQSQLALGDRCEAAALLDEAIAVARAGAMTWVLGRAARVRAELRAGEGDLKEAESLAHESLSLAHEAGDRLGLVDALELMARLAMEQGSAREAVRLWAAAESMRSELGYVRFPVDRAVHEAAVGAAKEALGLDDFSAGWAEGTALTPTEAIGYAVRGRRERRRPTTGWDSLTPSELEVARLAGQHLGNPEIAARLFVSRATVKTHLVHIFTKLGIDSRSELVAEAVRRGFRA